MSVIDKLLIIYPELGYFITVVDIVTRLIGETRVSDDKNFVTPN